ncbi:MAG TPA: hypothetical protein V6C89_05150 [Drouetiella sp.]
MIVIERKEIPVSNYKLTDGVPDVLNFDYCIFKSDRSRLLSAFLKGVVMSLTTLMISGFPICFQNRVVLGFVMYVAMALVANQMVEQKLSVSKLHSADTQLQRMSLSQVNPAFAVVPVVFLFSTMDMQTLMLALSTTIEVVGIACGVPFLLYGLIKVSQKSNFGRTHVYVGSASAFGGIAFSVVIHMILANGVDTSIFTATNYFSNAIATIYAPDVVLQLEE